ncbi:DISARM system SNF2-like helicase DrmD [Gloeobacter kilaueensis]|uniref:Helicase domain-containing protein n=1 Tax=Gloeobacter kilaueensis (strain ATCC BAA-2537 / CCAP 1431/1 / ULC 316 / JS1) TaxID=1183438 RepID=U5QDD5_GLOK1|nr:DISARM system SNF2-like helicase DrmD [Gloeobacter kilaueensis]AGY56937.1 helicase domain-containing protein [Gloeobacter kilaueensis JS1]
MTLAPGQVVRVRSRQYLVENIQQGRSAAEATLVALSCLEDDALGERLEVLWEREADAQEVSGTAWGTVAGSGFDQPQKFSAYLHTLRWHCVTATDPKLFQAPYRAGIEVKAYQLAPLRKALLLPRVNLFIADDVGLGKTIEAGLILREMLMRQKVRRVVIGCPPSVVRQWAEEMESRFGLLFQIFDRQFVSQCRQERGWGINPWTTHSRFIISQALLRDEAYAEPLRAWLGDFAPGAMLILDEAHNAAPASGTKYAIDSQLTRVVRDLAPRFEHKLFLSATPHNGHSNSFAALLEMLDPQRFCRGVPIKNAKQLDAVMVRRLKSDLREVGEEFPRREVIALRLAGLDEDAPELLLSRLLADYRRLRETKLKDAPRAQATAAMLVLTSLQKRLLSSIEAFYRTLGVHKKALGRQAERRPFITRNLSLLVTGVGPDDERADLSEEDVVLEEEAQIERASAAGAAEDLSEEIALVERMLQVAGSVRYDPDVKVLALADWLRENLCPDLGQPGARWLDRRVLIFTEYIDTKRYLVEQLESLIVRSDRAEERIAAFHGGMSDERREELKSAFNAAPADSPLRILVATDAAREGVNLQNHCADLFHFDIPWNPGRMEQRNGRIDRKLQRSAAIRCYYFVLPQRSEDRVLDVLVRKTQTIQQELGSLSPVLEQRVERLLEAGIRPEQVAQIEAAIEGADEAGDDGPGLAAVREELESSRVRLEPLQKELADLQELLKISRDWLGLSDNHFREALNASLAILGAGDLVPVSEAEARHDPARARWVFPAIDERFGADPSWAATLDTLRGARQPGQKPWQWRKESPIRPVIFRDPGNLDGKVVHLHLEQRVVKRLLGRFLSQGFVHDELSRACVVLTDDPRPKVVVLGRLSLYGELAARLHDEVIAVAAEWIPPERRGRSRLQPLTLAGQGDVLALVEASLATPRLWEVGESARALLKNAAAQDVEELEPHLKRRSDILAERATKKLSERGLKEAAEMRKLLEEQRRLIEKRFQDTGGDRQLELRFAADERRQLEADRRHWQRRLTDLEAELTTEPARIEANYQIKAVRIEPVGIVYLWPVSG